MDFLRPIAEEQERQPVPALSPDEAVQLSTEVLSLKLQLTQAAMCHEYARMEYERSVCVIRRGELLDEMEMYHGDYLEARARLGHCNPALLSELELEIRSQKTLVFGSLHS